VKRTSLEVLSEWLNDNVYFYTSDDGGRNSVYRASLKGKERVLISGANDNVKSASTVKDGKNLYVAVVTGNPLKSTLKLIDAASGRVTFQREFEAGWLVINGHHNNRFALSSSSFAKPFAEYEVHVSKGTAKVFERTGYPAQLLQKILHCNPSKVSFPTFDKPVVSGEKNKGMLHAFLMAPKHPREGREGRALVLSFYGGYNYHDVAFEIFCNAGYYVLSPALRGTNEFGTAFYTLGHGDWGGGETLDALSAGKWVAQRLRMAPQQIGIFGISRGGYDTMRAMTFPGSVRAQTADGSYRNVTETFRFGFGISDFGISDVISAYEEGNIAGWYVDLAGGDPRKDRPKWIDRSPITHADKLTGPLLLTHGSKDNRVPPGQSQRMYEKIKDLGKQKVVYLELPGQGHGYKGVDALSTYYRAVLKFLDELPD
jgi:dipeptidyl aminopeptidase/acylaminoacyl peptidase